MPKNPNLNIHKKALVIELLNIGLLQPTHPNLTKKTTPGLHKTTPKTTNNLNNLKHQHLPHYHHH